LRIPIRATSPERLQRAEFMRAIEAADWPTVRGADLSSGTILQDQLGPGEAAWTAFAENAPLRQLGHVRRMLAVQPSIFKTTVAGE